MERTVCDEAGRVMKLPLVLLGEIDDLVLARDEQLRLPFQTRFTMLIAAAKRGI